MSAVIAVVGTLLGSISTYAFQRASADRTERAARVELRRQERLTTYAEFAGAATALRRAAYDRWHRWQEEPDGAAYLAARDEYYRIYGQARSVHTKLRLLTDTASLVDLAERAIERATEIKDAGAEDERAARGERAKQALDAFLSAASEHLR